MSDSKNDIAWEKLFRKYNILEQIKNAGHFEISSAKINEFREARLMTKFDHESQLPKLFSQNKLSILPISRGGYCIGTFDAYYHFKDEPIEITQIEFSPVLESLNFRDITSEATAINCTFVTRILQDFTNEEELFPTVSGRMSSSSFQFMINSAIGSFNINVGNAQVEIDGGFEGEKSLNLIEAKNYISDDFLIRQLYYPFKLWTGKIEKQVRPIFLTYSNGFFHLREFSFTKTNHYNSIVLLRQKKYTLIDSRFNLEMLIQLIDKTKTIAEPEIPFPQADNFNRVINLCELISQNQMMTKEQYLQDFDFGAIDPRQHDYYTNAARYLGLVEKTIDPVNKQLSFILSNLGKKIMNAPLFERQKEFIKLIIAHKVFKQSLKLYLDTSEVPAKEQIVEIMRNSKLYRIESDSTFHRRASTILSWVSWIINQIEE